MTDRIKALEDALRKIRDDVRLMMTGRTSLLGKIERTVNDALAASQPAQVIDMRAVFMEEIEKAANESPWVPPEYMMNEVVSDCCTFLREPRDQPLTAQDAARWQEVAALIEGIGMARRRLETIASDAWNGDARDFKRSIVGVFSEVDEALRAIAGGE